MHTNTDANDDDDDDVIRFGVIDITGMSLLLKIRPKRRVCKLKTT